MPQAAIGAGPPGRDGSPDGAARRQDGATESTRSGEGPAGAQGRAAAPLGPGKGSALAFEPNRGQASAEIDYLARGPGYALSLTGGDAVFALSPSEGDETGGSADTAANEPRPEPTSASPGAVVHMNLVGAAAEPSASGAGRLPGVSNYLRGDEPGDWVTGVPHYAKVRYDEVYPGVDVAYRSKAQDGQLEYDLELAPGANPDAITVGFDGAEDVRLGEDGDLLVETSAGTLRQDAPVVYQPTADGRDPVAGRFVLRGPDRVGFRLGDYDADKPVVIDPVVTYSTYLGGRAADEGRGIAVDGDGSAYVTGQTHSPDFPTTGDAADTTCGTDTEGCSDARGDAFVTKLDANGDLVYSAFLGGSGDDAGTGIAVDDAGGAHVAGRTASSDFPGAGGSFGGETDAFVAKLAADGSGLAYAAYLGGGGEDVAAGVALDSSGNAYTAGRTASSDFPTTTGAYQESYGGNTDAFAAKLDGRGARVYATYVGGDERDRGRDVAVDTEGAAYVVGTGRSVPTTDGAYNTEQESGQFVTKLTPSGSGLAYSTYVGHGSGEGVAVDDAGSAYVTGSTSSSDAYVSKLGPDGANLVYSTSIGGSGKDGAHGIAVDPDGRAFVTGETHSSDLPTTDDAYDDTCEGFCQNIGDGFATRLSDDGSDVTYSTYLGGTQDDRGNAVAVDGSGDAYVTGATESDDFPTTSAAQSDYVHGGAAFVVKVAAEPPPHPMVRQINPRTGPTAGGTEVTITGTGFTDASAVHFGDRPARDFEIDSDTQITATSPAVGPPATRPKTVDVTVTDPDGTSPTASRARFAYTEGLWQPTAETATARSDHTATTLADGRVLVAGGTSPDDTVLASAKVYDPDEGTWSATAEDMTTARAGHTATLLDGPDCAGDTAPAYCGKVLVTGGTSVVGFHRQALETAELFDPEDGSWKALEKPMDVARSRHTATLLDGPSCRGDSPPSWCGKALIAGGPAWKDDGHDDDEEPDQVPQNATALYDPATGAFEPAADMPTARAYHTATGLDGPSCRGDTPPEWCDDVLMVGGQGTARDQIPPAEIYDPAGDAWRPPSGEANLRHVAHTATNLAGGGVLVAGGGTFIDLTAMGAVAGTPPRPFAEFYEPAASDPWRLTGSLEHARAGHAASWLPNGKVLAAGGDGATRSAELYEPGLGEWYAAPSMDVARRPPKDALEGAHTATLLSAEPDGFRADPVACGTRCGQMLVVGGSDEPTAELYTPGPSVTGVDPATAGAGSEVTITGTGFTAGEGFAEQVAVFVDGQQIDSSQVTVDSYSQITATTPVALDGSAGEVVVRTPAGLDDFPDPEPAEDDGGDGGTGGTGGTEDDGATDGDADETQPAAVDDPDLAPGRVDDLAAEAQSGTEIGLSFSSVGADGDGELPPAEDYIVKQSPEPIDSEAAFADAFALCGGVCSFSPAGVGDALTLTVTDLDPDATYHYAVKGRDEAGNLSERSNPASATTTTATVGDGPASACADDLVSASGFADVAADSVHRAAIDCVAWYAITLGMGDLDGDGANEYAPNRPITRAQMASFLVRLGGEAGLALPADAPDAFGDDDGSVHELRINALAALGITEGKGDLDGDGRDEYAPGQPVSRDQMASFIARLHRRVTGTLAEPGQDFFGDDDGSVHEDNINALAATGITEGKGDLDGDGAVEYAPRLPVSRAQMASFMARELDALAAAGAVHPGGAEVLLDATEVRVGEALTGRVRSHREVVSLTAGGCGLADEPVSLNPDLGFRVPVATDQPAGGCQLTLTAATSPIDPDAEGGPQSVAYDFTVTVVE